MLTARSPDWPRDSSLGRNVDGGLFEWVEASRTGAGTDAGDMGALNPWLMIYYTYMTSMRNHAGRSAAIRDGKVRLVHWSRRKVGTLEPDNSADLIVLSKDYFAVPEDEIRTLTSVLMLVVGRIVYAAAEYAGLDQP